MARRSLRPTESGGGGLALELRKFQSQRRQLHRILGETQRSLREVSHMNLFPLESEIAEALRISREGALRPASIVVLGPAKARLVNFLLGESLLPHRNPASPSVSEGWRWLRLKHGPKRQIRLSLGADFEVVEPALSLDSNWDQIPQKNLKRSDTMDLSTVMEIELCNLFLENGIQILVPPDLGDLSLIDKTPFEMTHESTIKDYESFYSKRGSLLENIYPIVIYALDELGPISRRKARSKLEHFSKKKIEFEKSDSVRSKRFLSRFRDFKMQNGDKNNYDISMPKFYVRVEDEPEVCEDHVEPAGIVFKAKEDAESIYSDYGSTNGVAQMEPAINFKLDESNSCDGFSGLDEENLLDLRQVHELHPNSQVLFALFSDSVERQSSSNPDLLLPPDLRVTNNNHKTIGSSASPENYSLNDSPLSFYSKYDYCTSEYSSVSPMSDFTPNKRNDFSSKKDGRSQNLDSRGASQDSRGLSLKPEPCPAEAEEKLSSSVKSGESIMFSMDDDKDVLLEKQRAYLTSLVEQLAAMTHPMLKQVFTGHWMIVDDSKAAGAGDAPHRSKTEGVMLRDEFLQNLVAFSKGCLKDYILDDCNEMSEIHNALLQQFIMSSFDMAREMQIVPRKIHYVAVMEQQLYDTLYGKFTGEEKREDLLAIIQRVLQDMKNNINSIDWEGTESSFHLNDNCLTVKSPNSLLFELDDKIQNGNSHHPGPDVTENGATQLMDCPQSKPDLLDNITDEFLKEYYIIKTPPEVRKETTFTIAPNSEGAVEMASPVVDISTVNLKRNGADVHSDDVLNVRVDVGCCKSSQVTFKQASLDVQRAVLARLSRNISLQLVNFVDCLRDSYFGTLQRCLESLEEGRGQRVASEAVRRILLVTRSVNLQQCASFSFLHALVDHLRRFFHRLSLSSSASSSCCVASPRWRKQVALDTIESLNAAKLARLISMQLRERVRLSHEQFQGALQALSDHHAARLQQTEELKLTVRKLHAPRFARLYLESTSLRDLVRHGVPHLGKEIGRGQYGVVYAVKGEWAGVEPCAVKSVVPPDERHFNELAMEFFHTKNIPPHDRIVSLLGSVVDHTYAGGSPAVLLVSQRLKWDLHCALLNANMTFTQRMQVAVDIVEGIRYLHSQGLVHRDIKLKNVLLEEDHRAKLTDLGFCIPEAMMSGSIVGTPMHMAPDLLSGFYDSSVDVYAFGVLFWYVCAGSVKLPCAFEHVQNKEQLWTKVKKGLRPERLPCFSDTCWELMEKCWAGEPARRPLLGDVQPVLEEARDHPEVHWILDACKNN